jgi:hypothetical protein
MEVYLADHNPQYMLLIIRNEIRLVSSFRGCLLQNMPHGHKFGYPLRPLTGTHFCVLHIVVTEFSPVVW